MKPEMLTRALLTWDDVADAVTNLPEEQQSLAAEIIAAERASTVDRVSIGEGPWHVVSALVSGHMGIGEQALSIEFTAGPGLTIVTARNGTGKTSFVDGVRRAISNGRQRDFEAVEQNLHHEDRKIRVSPRSSCGLSTGCADMGSWKRPDRDLLEAAYTAWPGTDHQKTAQKALLIRLRIEDVARGLPTSIIAGPPGSDRIRQRLMLSVGAPSLTQTDRERRIAVVRTAIGVYEAICGVLHGRDPDGRPPLADVTAWDKAVGQLEAEFEGHASVPSPREGSDERAPAG